jgi:AraC-like DNA-binding protein
LSSLKRDFNQVFNDTPNHWLVKRRLQESYFLIGTQHKKPTEIYLDLGFEDLSHFSHAFKKQFGLTPTALSAQTKINSR